MDIAAYCDWRIDLDDIAFFDKELARLIGQFANLGFWDRSTGAQLGDGTVGARFISDKPKEVMSDVTDLDCSSSVPSIGSQKRECSTL